MRGMACTALTLLPCTLLRAPAHASRDAAARPPPHPTRPPQGISFAGPAVCMIALAFLTPTTPGTGPAALIVGIMSLAFALGAWARAGLYCNHQDLSPKYAAALLGEGAWARQRGGGKG